MILVDTSAWIDFGRATGSDADMRLTALLRDEHPVAATEPVLMELLSGARGETGREQVRRLLSSVEWLSVDSRSDFEAAAKIYSDCRVAGITPRGLIDCLIAAVALRTGSSILSSDRDFEAMAGVLPLTLA